MRGQVAGDVAVGVVLEAGGRPADDHSRQAVRLASLCPAALEVLASLSDVTWVDDLKPTTVINSVIDPRYSP